MSIDDKWDNYIHGKLKKEDLQQVRQELGCINCEEERGTGTCYSHILLWSMNKIRGLGKGE